MFQAEIIQNSAWTGGKQKLMDKGRISKLKKISNQKKNVKNCCQ